MSWNGIDKQQLLIWAAVALVAYWIFMKKTESYGNVSVPHVHHHQQALTPTEHDGNVLGISPPPPEEIPQYASAFTL